MMVREDLSDAMVYDMLTGIFENIKTIQASHNAADKNIYLEVGVDDLQLPLHPRRRGFLEGSGLHQVIRSSLTFKFCRRTGEILCPPAVF